MKLTKNLKSLFIETAKKLKGSDKRQFMAKVVKELGIGGQSLAERELGWNRRTIRKGMKELITGETIEDNYSNCGRKRVEETLPNLHNDIKKIVDSFAQIDPSFKSTRLYSRMSASKVHSQLIEQCGYSEEELPSTETIRCRLNEMGYTVSRVSKAKPQKKIPETDAIFEEIDEVNKKADCEPNTLRISTDAKVAVKVGEFDRGGKSRIKTIALDHDFTPVATLIPYGIFLPQYNELYLFFVSSLINRRLHCGFASKVVGNGQTSF